MDEERDALLMTGVEAAVGDNERGGEVDVDDDNDGAREAGTGEDMITEEVRDEEEEADDARARGMSSSSSSSGGYWCGFRVE